jgi:predicted TIM-barrel fold metal-dependent hydrolase
VPTVADARLIDIHTHFRPPKWRVPAGYRPISFPQELVATLSDLDSLATISAAAGINFRALSAPVEQLWGPEGPVSTSDVNGVNELLAEIVRNHPDAFLGLATVDAFAGDDGAEQTRYAISELGLNGIVLDSSRQNRYLSSPEAYPTLELAASLGVPVFVHPVAANEADLYTAAAGRNGNSLGRGLQNGLSFLAALHAGLPERLPDLHLIFTSLGNGALYFAADQIATFRATHGQSPNLYFDTTRFQPPLLRYYGEVLGVERILVGTDWPGRDTTHDHTEATLVAAGFTADERDLIRAGNARRLFQLRELNSVAANQIGRMQ